MSKDGLVTLAPEGPDLTNMTFEATDVTGTHTVTATNVQPSLPAGAVANALAHRMALPTNVPWALRDDATSAFLDDNVAIGDQIITDARLTVTPKTHLG
jgi:hypothetical protein